MPQRESAPAPWSAPAPPPRIALPGRGGAVVYVPSAQSEWRLYALRFSSDRLGARDAEAAEADGVARPGPSAQAEVAFRRTGLAPSAAVAMRC